MSPASRSLACSLSPLSKDGSPIPSDASASLSLPAWPSTTPVFPLLLPAASTSLLACGALSFCSVLSFPCPPRKECSDSLSEDTIAGRVRAALPSAAALPGIVLALSASLSLAVASVAAGLSSVAELAMLLPLPMISSDTVAVTLAWDAVTPLLPATVRDEADVAVGVRGLPVVCLDLLPPLLTTPSCWGSEKETHRKLQNFNPN